MHLVCAHRAFDYRPEPLVRRPDASGQCAWYGQLMPDSVLDARPSESVAVKLGGEMRPYLQRLGVTSESLGIIGLAALLLTLHGFTRAEIAGVRQELGSLRQELGSLRQEVHLLGERVARIEGKLDIGAPTKDSAEIDRSPSSQSAQAKAEMPLATNPERADR